MEAVSSHCNMIFLLVGIEVGAEKETDIMIMIGTGTGTEEDMKTEGAVTPGEAEVEAMNGMLVPDTMMITIMIMTRARATRTGEDGITIKCLMLKFAFCPVSDDILAMGNSQSSSIAIEEITHPYIRTPRLTRQYYLEHLSGDNVSPETLKEQEPLYQIPPELLGKVSLHRSLDLSFNFIEEIPKGWDLHNQ